MVESKDDDANDFERRDSQHETRGQFQSPELSIEELARVLRYVSGEYLQSEEADLRAWVWADPGRRTLAHELASVRHSRSQDSPESQQWDAEIRLQQLLGEISRQRDSAEDDTREKVRSSARHHLLLLPSTSRASTGRRTAAVTLGAALVASLIVGFLRFGLRVDRVGPNMSQVTRTYSTAEEQQVNLRLPDGTHVRLAPGSRLRFDGDYGIHRREMYLEGEAFFEVTHDARRPFSVHTFNATLRDIGTAFSVRSYPEDEATQTVVRDGSVAFDGLGDLVAGDAGRITTDGRRIIQHHVPVNAMLAWIDGRPTLDYADAPLGQVLADLRRWEGMTVSLSDSSFLRSRVFSGSLTGLAPREALEIVSAALGLRITHRDGHTLVLEPLGRGQQKSNSSQN
jgi:transmembrane sensor